MGRFIIQTKLIIFVADNGDAIEIMNNFNEVASGLVVSLQLRLRYRDSDFSYIN